VVGGRAAGAAIWLGYCWLDGPPLGVHGGGGADARAPTHTPTAAKVVPPPKKQPEPSSSSSEESDSEEEAPAPKAKPAAKGKAAAKAPPAKKEESRCVCVLCRVWSALGPNAWRAVLCPRSSDSDSSEEEEEAKPVVSRPSAPLATYPLLVMCARPWC
jgi:outer membrane biosynthesis protein TonB